jgi:hypothetical protein
MLHDVSLWSIWCNLKVVNEALAALDEFGYVAAEFIPYFAPFPRNHEHGGCVRQRL